MEDHLRAACRFAAWDEEENSNGGPSVGLRFNEWWTGASSEGAYVNLHEAEIALAQLLPDDEIQAGIPAALARLETMDVTDPRRRAAETQLAVKLAESSAPGRVPERRQDRPWSSSTSSTPASAASATSSSPPPLG